MDPGVTSVLRAIDRGEAHAAAELLPLVYDELRRLADAKLANERPGQTLQATALVHEAYLRLLGPEGEDRPAWDCRGHFFAAAAEAMRRILIDRARARGTLKRGGDARRLLIDPALVTIDEAPDGLADLDAALAELDARDPVKASLVKLRFFGGLTHAQAGAALGLPPTTADRHWAFARAWLFDRLRPDE